MQSIKNCFVSGCTLILLMASCNKDQKLAHHLKGNWRIDHIALSDTSDVDLSVYKHSITFESCKDTYKATCRAYYFIDSASVNVYTDSVKYDLRDDEFTVSYVQKQSVIGYFKRRFSISDPESNNITLTEEGLAPNAAHKVKVVISKN